MNQSKYEVDAQYTRNDIFEILNLPEKPNGGSWFTGYHLHAADADYYVFCNVGTAGRTGHDYDNRWEGERLIWRGKPESHFGQPTIKNMLAPNYRVLVFYRDTDRSPFTFAGIGTPIPHYDVERPARIDWLFEADESREASVQIDERDENASFSEGTRVRVYVNRYERDRSARNRCIEIYGTHCAACDLDFEDRYGKLGSGFIHVHHRTPVSELGDQYVVDPRRDLIPVCPNCHAMLHRRNPPLSLDELKNILNQQ